MADHSGNRENWQSQAFRSKIVSKLEDEMKKNQTQMPKTSIEMEEYIFQRAGSREEYLDLVARVLLSVSAERRMQAQAQNPGAVPAQDPQDPIGALQNLTGQAASGMERQASNAETLIDTERLVSAVQKRAALYDKDDIRYANRAFIRQEWRKVAKEIGTDVLTAKKKWTHLRDYFQKQMKYFHSRSGSNAGFGFGSKRKWYLYDTMSFLIPYLQDRLTPRKLMEDSERLEYEEVEVDYHDDRSDVSSDFNNQLSTDHIPGTTTDTEEKEDDQEDSVEWKPLLKRSKHHHHQQQHHQSGSDDTPSSSGFNSDVMKTLNRVVDSVRGQRGTSDEDDCFFKSLIPNMKMLDPISKMECQSEIHAVVLRYLKQAALSSILDITKMTTEKHYADDDSIK